MNLPKIDYPTYEVYLKSLDKKIRFRPFLVKEEKLFLMVKESNDSDEIVRTIKQVINNCCIDEIDVDSLPMFDIEMFFVHLRTKSIGESAKLNFTCQNVVGENDGEEILCGHTTEYDLDLSKIKYETKPDHNQTVMLTPTVGMKLKYPTINTLKNDIDDFIGAAVDLIGSNLECIFDADSVYPRRDISDEALEEFLNSLSIEQVDLIRNFFNTSPRVILEDNITCAKCGHIHRIHAENLYSFFT